MVRLERFERLTHALEGRETVLIVTFTILTILLESQAKDFV